VRKLVRDVVDGRRNAGVLVLPVAVLLVLSSISGSRRSGPPSPSCGWPRCSPVLLDVVVLVVLIRRRVREEHPGGRRLGGHVAYGLLRSTVFRRWRMPPPCLSP
jgi:hypothetical protein